MKNMRCFLAFKLNLETVENIALSQRAVKSRCAEAGMTIRWVAPPNIHMTVQFLGEITEPMAAALEGMLDPIVSGFDTFDLTAVGMGAFPDVTHPRVIWAGLGEGADKLTAFHGLVRERLEAAGFNFDKKPFAAHITVGRVKSAAPGVLASCFGEDAARTFGVAPIRELHCIKSDLSRSGPEYTTLWVLPLQKSAPPRSLRQPISESLSDASQPVEAATEMDPAAEPSAEE